MSVPGYISNARVESVRLAECSVWTNPDGPGVSMSAEANVEMGQLSQVPADSDGWLSYAASVGITVQLVDEDGSMPRARASVKLVGVVSVPADEADPAHAAKVAAAASMYPQAQAYVSMLSSMAQVGTMPTPVIDPEGLVSAVDSLVAANGQ